MNHCTPWTPTPAGPTHTPTITFTPSNTLTPSLTFTPSKTFTPSLTPTKTNTPLPTNTHTKTPTLSPTPNIPAGQLKNPGFESGDLWGWNSLGSAEARVRTSSYGITPPQGSYMCGWNGYNIGSRMQTIWQTIQVAQGNNYEFSMKVYASRDGGSTGDTSIRLGVDLTGSTNFTTGTSWTETNGGWQTLTVPFTASGSNIAVAAQMAHTANTHNNYLFCDDAKLILSGGGTIIKGDCNCDGSVTPGDALMAFQFYLKTLTPATTPCNQTAAADMDDSGSVTPGDALCVFKEYLRNPC